jgi:tripartite-type tricarboxylate transporter receptor subunit TctC
MKRLLLAALLAFPLLAQGQYPSKPVRAVVAFGTGGAGGDGARSALDGYTLFFATSTQVSALPSRCA